LYLRSEVFLEDRAGKNCAICILNLLGKTPQLDNVTYKIKRPAFIEDISVC